MILIMIMTMTMLLMVINNKKYGFEKRPYCFEKDKCQSFVELICSQYDYIVISDIIPDSYIYFTNPCSAKVVLEITNRYDLSINMFYKNIIKKINWTFFFLLSSLLLYINIYIYLY